MGAAVSALCLQCVPRLQIVSLYGVSEHAAGVGCQSTHCDLQVGTTVGVVGRCGVGDPAANGVKTPCLLGRSVTRPRVARRRRRRFDRTVHLARNAAAEDALASGTLMTARPGSVPRVPYSARKVCGNPSSPCFSSRFRAEGAEGAVLRAEGLWRSKLAVFLQPFNRRGKAGRDRGGPRCSVLPSLFPAVAPAPTSHRRGDSTRFPNLVAASGQRLIDVAALASMWFELRPGPRVLGKVLGRRRKAVGVLVSPVLLREPLELFGPVG